MCLESVESVDKYVFAYKVFAKKNGELFPVFYYSAWFSDCRTRDINKVIPFKFTEENRIESVYQYSTYHCFESKSGVLNLTVFKDCEYEIWKIHGHAKKSGKYSFSSGEIVNAYKLSSFKLMEKVELYDCL